MLFRISAADATMLGNQSVPTIMIDIIQEREEYPFYSCHSFRCHTLTPGGGSHKET